MKPYIDGFLVSRDTLLGMRRRTAVAQVCWGSHIFLSPNILSELTLTYGLGSQLGPAGIANERVEQILSIV